MMLWQLEIVRTQWAMPCHDADGRLMEQIRYGPLSGLVWGKQFPTICCNTHNKLHPVNWPTVSMCQECQSTINDPINAHSRTKSGKKPFNNVTYKHMLSAGMEMDEFLWIWSHLSFNVIWKTCTVLRKICQSSFPIFACANLRTLKQTVHCISSHNN